MTELFGILFLCVVAPIWIVFHYLTKAKTAKNMTPEDESMLADVWESARKMEQRIHTLEKILDQESPGWRGRQ